MIKKLILISAMLIGLAFFGSISVDERENAVVTNLITKNKQLLTRGLHFVLPGIYKVSYIFINQRNAVFTSVIAFNTNVQVKVSNVVVWQVTDPLKYYNSINTLSGGEFNKAIANEVLQVVNSRALSTNLSTFNQLNNLLVQPLQLNQLGIRINSISPCEFELTAMPELNTQAAVTKTESQAQQLNLQDSQIAIESAYYKAQLIKTAAEIKQANMLQSLEVKNPGFYNYFRKLQLYRNSAKSKQDMPPLEELLK